MHETQYQERFEYITSIERYHITKLMSKENVDLIRDKIIMMLHYTNFHWFGHRTNEKVDQPLLQCKE